MEREGTWVIRDVDINQVQACRPAMSRDITYQMERLQERGQIEPLTCIQESTGRFVVRNHLDDWIYASAQLMAARELEWPTVLITYREKSVTGAIASGSDKEAVQAALLASGNFGPAGPNEWAVQKIADYMIANGYDVQLFVGARIRQYADGGHMTALDAMYDLLTGF